LIYTFFEGVNVIVQEGPNELGATAKLVPRSAETKAPLLHEREAAPRNLERLDLHRSQKEDNCLTGVIIYDSLIYISPAQE
jgi:hypothetical protein